MKIIKRALFYITRKRSKSFVLSLILIVISTLILSGLATKDAEIKKSEELRGTTGSGFSLKAIDKWDDGDGNSDSGGNFDKIATNEPITKEMIEDIMAIHGLKGYAVNMHSIMSFYDMNDAPYVRDFNNPYQLSEWPFNVFQGNHYNNSEYAAPFLGRKVALVEGRHIKDTDKNVVIISKPLADKLGLKVGDTIKALNNPEVNDPAVTLKIIGLFEVLIDEEDPQNNLDGISEDDLYGGFTYQWFSDMSTYKDININYADAIEGYENGYLQADFYVSDPKNLEKILQAVQNLSGIDWDDYEISANDKVYERTGSSMSDISQLIQTLILVIVAISVGIITLILTMWAKSRIRETGIMMAAGIRKSAILLQHILEVWLLAIISFPIAYICSKFIAGPIGKMLGKTGDITVTMEHFIIVFGLGMILLLLVTIISYISILRMKPKEILTRMS